MEKTFSFLSSSLNRSGDKGEKNKVVQWDFYYIIFLFLIYPGGPHKETKEDSSEGILEAIFLYKVIVSRGKVECVYCRYRGVR